MDINKVAISQDGVWFNDVTFVDGSPTDLCFLIVGKNSDEFKKIERKFSKGIILDRKKTAEELSEQQLEVVTACVKNWKNLTDGGVQMVCNYDTKRKLFGDPKFNWLVKKIDDFIGEDCNFLSAEQAGKK